MTLLFNVTFLMLISVGTFENLYFTVATLYGYIPEFGGQKKKTLQHGPKPDNIIVNVNDTVETVVILTQLSLSLQSMRG